MLIRAMAVILVVAVAAVSGYFYTSSLGTSKQTDSVYAQAQGDQRNLNLINAQNQTLTDDINQLQAQASKANNDISQEMTVVPAIVNPNDLVQALLNQGQEDYVTIIPLSVGEWTPVQIGSNDYMRLDARIKISGEMAQVVKYITFLQKSQFSTLSVKGVSLAPTVDNPAIVDADINFSLYANDQ
jgi:hypothetical protein